jgi:hypothetical protein
LGLNTLYENLIKNYLIYDIAKPVVDTNKLALKRNFRLSAKQEKLH